MFTDEIGRLRYCYYVLRRRIEEGADGLEYWKMNFKIAAYFLRRYDPEFDPKGWFSENSYSDAQEDNGLTHALLERPSMHKKSYPKLTKELEEQLKERVANYFDSIEKTEQ